MIVYLDTSVVLRPLLDQPKKLSGWGQWEAAYSSELMGVECRRVIDRLRLEAIFDDKEVAEAIERLTQIERTIKRIRLTKSIIHAASQTMPTVVKTLDAFHLTSAIAVRERRAIELFFATHDTQQATAARALGFTCLES
ncbi:MAG TPA: PIN domain-containing protein [Terriglobia bacterium]|nr:PIN domain-containing protein [Terriglobia bacterium]